MATEQEVTTLRAKVRVDQQNLQNARGAFARRPQTVLQARERADHYDRDTGPAQATVALGARDAGREGMRRDVGLERDAAETGLASSAKDFVDARDAAAETVAEGEAMVQAVDEQAQDAQERIVQAGQIREEAGWSSPSLYAGGGGPDEQDDDRAFEDSDEGSRREALEQQATDHVAQAKQDLVLWRQLSRIFSTEHEGLVEEVRIATDPNFEGWGVDGFEEKEVLRGAITRVERENDAARERARAREQARQQNSSDTKRIVGGGIAGAAIGALGVGALGAVAGYVAGAFLGSSAIGAAVGAGAGALLGGLLGGGVGLLSGAIDARRRRQPQGAGPDAPTASAGDPAPAAREADEESRPRAASDDLLDRMDEDADGSRSPSPRDPARDDDAPARSTHDLTRALDELEGASARPSR